MDDVTTFLAAVNAESAKQRERVIKNLSPLALQNSQVIDALQRIVSTDAVEYVREAAHVQLFAAGQAPAASAAPVALKQVGAGKAAIFALGCVGLGIALTIACAVVVIAVLAIMGPQIGNIFSHVTNGLAGGTP